MIDLVFRTRAKHPSPRDLCGSYVISAVNIDPVMSWPLEDSFPPDVHLEDGVWKTCLSPLVSAAICGRRTL